MLPSHFITQRIKIWTHRLRCNTDNFIASSRTFLSKTGITKSFCCDYLLENKTVTAGTVWCYIKLVTQAVPTPVRVLCSSTSLLFPGAERYDERRAQVLNKGSHVPYALIIFTNTTVIKLLWLFCQRITLWFGLFLRFEFILKCFCVFHGSTGFCTYIAEHQELDLILLTLDVLEQNSSKPLLSF